MAVGTSLTTSVVEKKIHDIRAANCVFVVVSHICVRHAVGVLLYNVG